MVDNMRPQCEGIDESILYDSWPVECDHTPEQTQYLHDDIEQGARDEYHAFGFESFDCP